MKRIGIKAQVGYRSPRARKGEASIVSPNRLQRQFNPDAPDERWVTDITYIRTHEGWLYLAVVVDLFSRKIIGWSMQSRMTKDIVLNALLMAVWRRNPQKQVLVHSDQGSQYTSHEWQSFLKSHGLEGSMSRRGNCHDNGVVCGRGRNPTLRLWPAIFSGEIDVFPSERRNMGQEIGR